MSFERHVMASPAASSEMIRPLDRRAKLIRRKPLKHDRLSRRVRLREIRGMTICISALADRGAAIVCVADKMVSFGEYLQWDSDVTKIIHIPGSRCVALVAGSLSHCEAVLNGLNDNGEFGGVLDDSINMLKQSYTSVFSYFQDTEVLHRRGLDRNAYHQALRETQVPRIVEKLYEEMEAFSFQKWDCDLSICGFDKNDDAFMISAISPGLIQVQTIQGYHSIGIACNIANSRLLFSQYKREHKIGRVLFDLFDAKVNAEMSSGVGFTWDAQIVFPDGVGLVPEKPLKDLLERAWDHHNLSPFEKWSSKENMPKPGSRWKERILGIKKDDLHFTQFKEQVPRYPRSTKADQSTPLPSPE
jgi:hypothetical protein